MTQDQREWVEAEKNMINLKLQRAKIVPTKSISKLAWTISNYKYFD